MAEKLAEDLSGVIHELVIEEVKAAVRTIKPLPGPQGPPGPAGRDADPLEIKKAVKESARRDIAFGGGGVGLPPGQAKGQTLINLSNPNTVTSATWSYALGVPAEGFGASPSASAAINTAAIQAALNVGGLVTLEVAGVYFVNATLIIKSRTSFILGPGVIIRAFCAVPNTTKAFLLLRNENWASTAQKVSSIVGTQPFNTSLNLYTVTFSTFNPSSAGWTAGQYIQIKDDTTRRYNGINEIYSVTSNTVTFIWAQGAGGSPIGNGAGANMQAALADGYITVQGGEFDGNFRAGFVANTTYNDHGIFFDRLLKGRIANIRTTDFRKYAVCAQNVQDFVVDGLYGNTNSDGVKVYGPAWNPMIQNVDGTFGDDVCSFQTVDGPSFLVYMAPDNVGSGLSSLQGGTFWTGGSMKNVSAVSMHSGTMVLYPNGGSAAPAGFTMDGVYTLEDSNQTVPSPIGGGDGGGQSNIIVGAGYVTQPGRIECLMIRNNRGLLNIDNSGENKLITIDTIVVQNVSNDQVRGNDLIWNFDYVTVNNFVVSGCQFYSIDTNRLITLRSVNATIKQLTFDNCKFASDATGGNNLTLLGTLSGTGTLTRADLNSCFIGQKVHVVNGDAFSNTPIVCINGGQGDTYSSMFTMTGSQGLNIYMTNFKSSGASVGMFNWYGPSTGTFNVYISGMNHSGTTFANQTGTINWYNPDGSLPVDITKIARAAGATAKHNGGTAAGTIVANNLCVCDATGAANSWHQVSAPIANVY
jgi:hypothetical protein